MTRIPPPGTNDSAAPVEDALRQAAAAIGAARTLLDQGSIVDLTGLEAHVDRACAAIASLPRPERQPLKPALVALIDGLGGLAGELSAQHREITSALTGIGARHQAVSAYKPAGRT